MAHKIDSNICITCGQCEAICPQVAISFNDGKYEINPDLCVDCAVCAENCPVEAISKQE